MNETLPFVKAKPLLVKVPDHDCFIDGYIDDGIATCVNIGDNVRRLQNFVPLAIHFKSIARTLCPTKTSGRRFTAKRKMCPLMRHNTRLSIVKLPVHKFIALSGDLKEILTSRTK